jgi:hypothetical protein
VYKPAAVIVPQLAPAQPGPETLQATLLSIAFCTVAVNCCVVPAATLGLAGATVTTTAASTVTTAMSDFVGSAADVAVTLTVAGDGTPDGAVYSPVLLMLPHAVPVHPLPGKLHVTAVLVVLLTVAVNCCVFTTCTFAVAGVTVTLTLAGGVGAGALLPPPPQLAKSNRTPDKLATNPFFMETSRRGHSRTSFVAHQAPRFLSLSRPAPTISAHFIGRQVKRRYKNNLPLAPQFSALTLGLFFPFNR